MANINNINDLAQELGVPVDGIEKAVYKSTDCGAWIKCLDNGIKLGSIVEGSDLETKTFKLDYTFTSKEFWDALQEIDDEADMLWHEANDGIDKAE